MLDQFRSDLAIRDVHVPVLMVHGEDDDVIPVRVRGCEAFDFGNSFGVSSSSPARITPSACLAALCAQGADNYFFRMSRAVNGSSVDPVHSQLKRGMDRGNRVRVVLLAPSKVVAGTTNGPIPNPTGVMFRSEFPNLRVHTCPSKCVACAGPIATNRMVCYILPAWTILGVVR